MTKQVINRGTTAGDGTGENLFDAYGKVNANFTELYDGTETRKIGKSVFLWPSDTGEYTTAALAIADVDEGGTLWIMDTYDVTTHGTINITKSISIKGAGYSSSSWSGPANMVGSVITNTGTTETNCILIDAGGTDALFHLSVKDIGIVHQATDGYAIVVKRMRWCDWDNITILCGNLGLGGIHFEGQPLPGTDPAEGSWFQFLRNLHINNFTERGLWFDENIGSKNRIESCIIQALIENVGHIAAIELTAQKDYYICDCQIDCGHLGAPTQEDPPIPGILINATAVNGCRGHVIERCLTEHGGPLVRLTSTYEDPQPDPEDRNKCYDCMIRDCNTWIGADRPFMQIVEFDWAVRCIMETPLQYGKEDKYGETAGSAEVCTFTANSKNNLAILHSRWGNSVITDAGLNNTIKCMGMEDKALIKALRQWEVGHQHVEYSPSAGTALQRREGNTLGDMSLDVWKPMHGEFHAEELLTSESCKLWLDASDLSTMWQGTSKVTPVTADADPVLYWADKSGHGNDFNCISGQKSGYTFTLNTPTGETTITASSGYFTPLKVNGNVAITGVTGDDAASINGLHAAVWLTDNTFKIPVDSTGFTIDGSEMLVQVIANTPELETDVDGRGIYGVLFDGSEDMMEQVAKRTSIALDEVNEVGTMLMIITPQGNGTSDYIIGRYSKEFLETSPLGGDSIRRSSVKWGNVTGDFIYHNSSVGDNTYIVIGTRIDDGATFTQEIYSSMSDFKISDSGVSGDLAGDGYPWQIGTRGTDDKATDTYHGYIHAIALFARTLTESECRELMFYFSNKFIADPVEAYDL